MEFSQRPGTHGFAAAAPPLAHYQSPPGPADAYLGAPRRLPSLTELLVSQESAQQAAVAGHRPQDPASFSMHQQQQHQQQQHQQHQQQQQQQHQQHQQHQHAVAGSGDHHGQSPQGGYAAFGVPAYLAADSQRTAYPIDLPAPVATQYRDSESASSSVSSQGTLIDTCLSVEHHYAVAKQVHQHPGRAHTHMSSAGPFAASQTIQLASGMCEEDVFAAASILMSLRTCKLPC